ncbi:TonB-dependent receptor [Roseomonas sp. 18066]|uniref:TonB-dependent siderophore receptor n=1 Tax=Roseomonas sp. 18066 TaxID=2681412 RepID=UPI0013597BD2|nr:TonB-dependent receptor [Roseomonas sp. 18066]
MNRPKLAPRLAVLLACTMLTPLPMLVAPAAAQEAAEGRFRFDIPARPIPEALNELGRVTGLSVVFTETVPAGALARPVMGQMTARQALTALLAGTGFTWRFSGANAVTLLPVPPIGTEGAMLLPDVNVAGARESAWGPVQGYRATRSATGTRTDTALRDVPQSISVIPREVIEDQEARSLDQVLENVSGVRSGGSVGNRGETYLVRGFRTNLRAVDGVMLNPVLGFPEAFADLANVERVEVLKGPASVLYGQGEPGGLINIVTRRPEMTPSAGLTLEGGSYGHARSEFDVTGPLGETVAGRLSGAVQRDNGWRDGMPQTEREFIAPSVQWQPDAQTRIRLDATYINTRSGYARGLVAQGEGVSMSRRAFLGENWSRYASHRADITWRAEREINDWLTLRHIGRLDWGHTHRLMAEHTSLGRDGRTLGRRAYDQNDNMNSMDLQFDATLRFRTGPLRHTLLAGLEYVEAETSYTVLRAEMAGIDILNPVRGTPIPYLPFHQYARDGLTMLSFFAQDQVEVTPRLKLLGGLRYDRYALDRLDNQIRTRTRLDTEGDAVSPRLGATYALTPEVTLFASWSRSFVPQMGADRLGRGFEPETGQQFEGGIKADLLGEQLSVTLAAFQIRRSNVLATDPLVSGFNVQTGEQRARGVEAELSGEITPGWRWLASGAYTDAEITSDTTFAEGRRLAGVPLWSGSLWTSYELRDGRLSGLMLGGGAFASSTRSGDLNNSYRVGGFTRVDVTASYPVLPQARLAVSVRNLFDADYIEAPVRRTENYAGAPRTVLVALKARF